MEFVRTLKALADPLRLRILAAVSEEELTVGEVQEVVESVQSSVSRNLAILREAGFVQDRKEGTSVYFSARQPMPEPAREVFQFVAIPPRRHSGSEARPDTLGGNQAAALAAIAELLRVGGGRLGAHSQKLFR